MAKYKCGAGYEVERMEDGTFEVNGQPFEVQYVSFLIEGLELLRIDYNEERCKALPGLTHVLESDYFGECGGGIYEHTTFTFQNGDKFGKISVSTIDGQMKYYLSNMGITMTEHGNTNFVQDNELIKVHQRIMEFIK